MIQKGEALEQGLQDLVSAYREVERRGLSLPAFSLTPLLAFYWSYAKFIVGLILDPYIRLPVNGLVVLRNLFPGHRRYARFSSVRFIKNGLLWVWRGEAP